MANSRRAMISVRAWKEHTCVGCGSCYRYPLNWKQCGWAGSAEAAAAAAHAAAVRNLKNKIQMHPCPGCGRYQPEMVERRRATAHAVVLVAATVLLFGVPLAGGLAFSSIAGEPEGLRIAPLIAAVVVALTLAAHAVVVWWDPNRNLDANLKRATRGVECGALELGAYDPSPVEAPRGRPWLAWGACLLIALAAVLFPLPEALRVAYNYPANTDCWPTAAGPGDTVRIWFPRHISSVKGLWQGKATARVLNAGEFGLPDDGALDATSASTTWGTVINDVKEEDKQSNTALWADVYLPADPDLAAQNLKLEIDLDVIYPVEGSGEFHDVQASYHRKASIDMASSPRAGVAYRVWWMSALTGGCALTILGGVLLAARSAYLGRPSALSRVYVSNVEESERPDRSKQGAGPDGYSKDDPARPPIRDETAVRKPDSP